MQAGYLYGDQGRGEPLALAALQCHLNRVTVRETSKLVQVFTLFLRFPRESFPSWPTAPALVSSGLPGGSEEKENLQFDFNLPQYKQAFDRGMDEKANIDKKHCQRHNGPRV